MKNSEKAELRRYVKELSAKGYLQKEGVKRLVEEGYSYSTARSYWIVFAKDGKYFKEKLKQKAWHSSP